MMAVPLREVGDRIEFGAPTALFKVAIPGGLALESSPFDVSRDSLFLVPTGVGSACAAPMTWS